MTVDLLAATLGSVAGDVGRSLEEAFFMFWATLWALILGFALSGAVQAFVSREEMRTRLGDHGPASVARASLFGMVSSSCSYAASAMAKSLFKKGADFVSAMVFMFASTNLVVELGVVLLILMGWQFAASEFVGGAIMIVLLATFGALALRGRVVTDARRNVETDPVGGDPHAGHDHAGHDHAGGAAQRLPWSKRVRSAGGWADAASYTMADLTMLRREMVIGYLVAGFLAVLVPVSVWNAVFIKGHGFGTTLENVVVGPFIALISFVCSVGNVPLAAALWQGGIAFGGVVAFVFADLIALPLLLIYRRFYGGRTALRLLVTFWVIMSTAGLLTELIFDAAGLIPTTRRAEIVPEHFSWNYTTFLNFVFLIVFAFLYWAYRNQSRLGGGAGYAIDPVCGMQVETAHAAATVVHEGTAYFFCADRCADRFRANPETYLRPGATPAAMEPDSVPVSFGRLSPSAGPAGGPGHDGRDHRHDHGDGHH